MTYYRIQQADRDVNDLLDPENWQSAQWNDYGDDIRYGVSTCRSIDDLIEYFGQVGGDPDGCVLIELTGDHADDDDHDAHLGAILIHPTQIVSVRPVPSQIARAISDRQDEVFGI